VPVTSCVDEFETGGLKELDKFAGVSVQEPVGPLVLRGDDIARDRFRAHALAIGNVGKHERRAQQDQSIWRQGWSLEAVNRAEHAKAPEEGR
jgi:hypothetical protein